MVEENAKEFFAALGFAETEIEDGLSTLFYETSPEESFALLTDEEGAVPENLKQSLIFACYMPDGAFEWSASFKNAHAFRDVWAGPATVKEKLSAVLKHREQGYK